MNYVVISYKKNSTGDSLWKIGPKCPTAGKIMFSCIKNLPGVHSIKKRPVPRPY